MVLNQRKIDSGMFRVRGVLVLCTYQHTHTSFFKLIFYGAPENVNWFEKTVYLVATAFLIKALKHD